ncbi:MAG: 1-deoxy-D-xylulose-5-phosphate reductoisomerase, partial [Pseudonocardiaceae bacterium]
MDLSNRPRSVLLLGSTGSIGVQALDVVARNPQRFRVVGLAAGGADPQALAAQVLQTGAGAVAIARARSAQDLQLALFAEAQRRGYDQGGYRMPRILAGPEAVAELVATQPADVVLNGVTGSRGLAATLAALRSGAILALANKESLVAGGALVTGAAAAGQIVPVDSEHSALAQCLRAGTAGEVARLVLTASGG